MLRSAAIDWVAYSTSCVSNDAAEAFDAMLIISTTMFTTVDGACDSWTCEGDRKRKDETIEFEEPLLSWACCWIFKMMTEDNLTCNALAIELTISP